MKRSDSNGWRADYARRLKEVLGLSGSPVAVTYSDRPAGNARPGKYRACGAVPSARDGATVSLSKASSACRGAAGHLGLGAPAGNLEEMLLCGFLVYSEKLWASVSSARRALAHTSRRATPRRLGDYVTFSPLERAEEDPDLVLFMCNPEQACRLTALARYREGVLPPSEMEGSFCWNTITFPLVTGNVNVSLGDSSARRIERWDPNELVVSVPTPKLHGIMESVDSCTAGSASPAWRLQPSRAR
jgi:uncharacterized protein (DUF169 family)